MQSFDRIEVPFGCADQRLSGSQQAAVEIGSQKSFLHRFFIKPGPVIWGGDMKTRRGHPQPFQPQGIPYRFADLFFRLPYKSDNERTVYDDAVFFEKDHSLFYPF